MSAISMATVFDGLVQVFEVFDDARARDQEERTRSRSDRDDLVTRAYQTLYDEFVEAIHTNPSTTIQTPGWGSLTLAPRSVACVIADDLSGDGEPMHDLLQIIVGAANGDDMQIRASAWIAERAAEHAKFHCDDLATEMEEGGDE